MEEPRTGLQESCKGPGPAAASPEITAANDYPPREAWQVAYAVLQPELGGLHPGGSQGAAGSAACPGAPGNASEANPTVSARPAAVGPVSSPWPLVVPRSSQLDAARLDTELSALLSEQLRAALALLPTGMASRMEPELAAILRLVLYGVPLLLAPSASTPGASLLNLRYRSEGGPLSHLLSLAGRKRSPAPGPGASPASAAAPAGGSGGAASAPAAGGVAADAAAAAAATIATCSAAAAASSLALGGRTGVEGPGLSRLQRILLLAGSVGLPYLWARLGTALASRDDWGGGGTWGGGRGWSDDGGFGGGQRSGWDSWQQQGQQRVQQGAAGAGPEDDSAAGLEGRRSVIRQLQSVAPRMRAVWDRWLQLLVQAAARRLGGSRGVWRAMQALEVVYCTASLANLLGFLAGGQYRSLLEWAVGARLVWVRPTMSRAISFEYLNRQLVWQEVSELLLFVLPLLDGLRSRGTLARLLPRLPDPRSLLSSSSALLPGSMARAGAGAGKGGHGDAGEAAGEGEGQEGAAGHETQTQPRAVALPEPCVMCGASEPVTPMISVCCGHSFCYYCGAAACAADASFACPRDGVRVTALRRWKPRA